MYSMSVHRVECNLSILTRILSRVSQADMKRLMGKIDVNTIGNPALLATVMKGWGKGVTESAKYTTCDYFKWDDELLGDGDKNK